MLKTVRISTQVYCTLQIEGLHNWPDCNLLEVEYLKYPHRHLFYIKAYKNVDHDNRDVEFIILKHEIIRYLNKKYYEKTLGAYDFGPRSCEQIAKELISTFNLEKCDVSEDNENGAIVSVIGLVEEKGE